MDKIEKIRQEIERLKKQEKENEKAELMSDSWILGRQVMLEHFEHFLNTLSEEPCKSLDEAYLEKEIKDTCREYRINDSHEQELGKQDIENIARHFYELGQSQIPMPEDTVLFQKGVAEGRRLEREGMLKDAEECELYWDGDFLAIDLNMVALGYSEKDKVKVIVLKDNEDESK